MSDAVKNAHEVDSLVVEDPATAAKAGFFVTGVLPHVHAPDASVGTICIRRISATESIRYRAMKDNPSTAADWEEEALASDNNIDGGSATSVYLPEQNIDGGSA